MTFTKGFGAYVVDGDSIDCEVDGITYTARVVFDADSKVADFDYPAMPSRRGTATSGITTASSSTPRSGLGADAYRLALGHRRQLPGSDNSYLLEVANQLLPEAIELVKKDGMA
jgi:hypothetical protein